MAVLISAAATIADTVAYDHAGNYLRVFDTYSERVAHESGSRLGLKLLKTISIVAAAKGSSW